MKPFDPNETAGQYIDRLEAEIGRLRATLLNIQALAESGFSLDNAHLASRCRAALAPANITSEGPK